MNNRRRYDLVKRGLDIVFAGVGLIALSPIMGATALVIRVKLGSPVIFKQERPGVNGELFTLYKFRSMKIVDEHDDVENDHLRITPFGRVLRSLSLDELPSLVNVLKGDMSFVGPRPLLAEYLGLYTSDQMRRHDVRPGITGLAQIKGRNAIDWDDKFAYDLQYVEQRGFLLDVQILLATLGAVIQRRDISKEGLVTTDRFMGSADGS